MGFQATINGGHAQDVISVSPNKREWLGLYENHPDSYMKASKYETIIPEAGIRFTWCDDMSLQELLLQKDKIMSDKSGSNVNNGKTALKLTEVLSNVFNKAGE